MSPGWQNDFDQTAKYVTYALMCLASAFIALGLFGMAVIGGWV